MRIPGGFIGKESSFGNLAQIILFKNIYTFRETLQHGRHLMRKRAEFEEPLGAIMFNLKNKNKNTKLGDRLLLQCPECLVQRLASQKTQ